MRTLGIALALCLTAPIALAAPAPDAVSHYGQQVRALDDARSAYLTAYRQAVVAQPQAADVLQVSMGRSTLRPGEVLRATVVTSRPTRVRALLLRPGDTKALRAVNVRATKVKTAAVARVTMTIPVRATPGRYRLRISTIDGIGQDAWVDVRR